MPQTPAACPPCVDSASEVAAGRSAAPAAEVPAGPEPAAASPAAAEDTQPASIAPPAPGDAPATLQLPDDQLHLLLQLQQGDEQPEGDASSQQLNASAGSPVSPGGGEHSWQVVEPKAVRKAAAKVQPDDGTQPPRRQAGAQPAAPPAPLPAAPLRRKVSNASLSSFLSCDSREQCNSSSARDSDSISHVSTDSHASTVGSVGCAPPRQQHHLQALQALPGKSKPIKVPAPAAQHCQPGLVARQMLESHSGVPSMASSPASPAVSRVSTPSQQLRQPAGAGVHSSASRAPWAGIAAHAANKAADAGNKPGISAAGAAAAAADQAEFPSLSAAAASFTAAAKPAQPATVRKPAGSAAKPAVSPAAPDTPRTAPMAAPAPVAACAPATQPAPPPPSKAPEALLAEQPAAPQLADLGQVLAHSRAEVARLRQQLRQQELSHQHELAAVGSSAGWCVP